MMYIYNECFVNVALAFCFGIFITTTFWIITIKIMYTKERKGATKE